MMDREELLENGVPASGYLWCSHCGRCYPYGSYRVEIIRGSKEAVKWVKSLGVFSEDEVDDCNGQRIQVCPYSDCDGDTVIDAWDWEDIRSKHPEYPEVPEYGCVYAL